MKTLLGLLSVSLSLVCLAPAVPLEVDSTASGYWTQLMGWVTN